MCPAWMAPIMVVFVGNLDNYEFPPDNMHLHVFAAPQRVEQMPNGTVKRKMTPAKGNSVAFALDNDKDMEEDDEGYLWPKLPNGEAKNGDKKDKIEPNPQLYCKYLEV